MLNSKGSIAFKSALLAGAAMVAYSGIAANAQDSDKDEKVEKVTVTGTRIKARDFNSISPLATVTAQDIQLTGTVNTEQLINSLPQVIPGVTITSNNPSLNGFATVDLRGVGANRTLVLINGRRANPSSASGLVDLNTIPATLLERIEIITGGASAVYGADAVAGAVNFILRDNYQGIEIGSQYSQTEDGLAPAWTANAIMGGKFDGDRGSIQMALQYYNRQAVEAQARGFSRYAGAVMTDGVNIFPSLNQADINNGNLPFFSGGSGTAPWGSVGGFSVGNITLASGLTLDADCRAANGVQSTGGTIRFRNGGGIAPFQNCIHPDSSGAPDADGDRYNFAPDNFLILGNERYNAAVFGKYDILPDGVMTAFLDATYTNSTSTQQLAATPATGLQVKYDLDPTVGNVVVNPYVTGQPQLLSLASLQFGGIPGLDNRNFVLNIRTTQVGNRFGIIETNAFSTTQGLRGVIPTLDWDWELYHNISKNSSTVKNNNNIGATAMTQLLNACNTTSLAAQPQPLGSLPNCPFPTRTGPGPSAFVPTPTTNNPLGVFSMSQDMINFVRVNSTDVINYERSIIAGNTTGELFDLWGEGAISAALGFEYRIEELDSRVDPFKNAGDIIGFNAQKNIAGGYDVYELYGEVEVPLITGETLFENLSLTGGYRKSDYSTGAGITETWKIGGEWAPFEWLKFRAVENHAVRAPSVFELFRAGDQNFPAYADPCDKDTVALLVGPAQAARIAACTNWFAGNGVVYNSATFDQNNAQVQAFLFGNPNLQPEIADTLTYGVVFQPDWFPVGKLDIAVDRYEIELENQIGQRGIATILNACIAANGNVLNADCANAPRDPLNAIPGNISAINQSLANFVGVSLYTGVDVAFNWAWDMEGDIGLPGTFSVRSFYTWTDESNGEVGLFVGSIGGIIAEHKAATQFNYVLEDWTFGLRWNYTGAAQDAIFGFERIPSYNLYSLATRWDMTDDLSFTAGVDNMFDKQPPVWAGAIGNGQFNTDGSTYEQLGRQYRMAVTWRH